MNTSKVLELQRLVELQEWSADATKRIFVGYEKGSHAPKKLWATWLYLPTRHGKTTWRIFVRDSAEGLVRVKQDLVDTDHLAPGLQHLGSGWVGGAFEIWSTKYSDHYKSQLDNHQETAVKPRKRPANDADLSPPASISKADGQVLEDAFFTNLERTLDKATLQKFARHVQETFALPEAPPVAVLEYMREFKLYTGESWGAAPDWIDWLKSIDSYPCQLAPLEAEDVLDWTFASSKRRRIGEPGSPESGSSESTLDDILKGRESGDESEDPLIGERGTDPHGLLSML